MRDDIHRRLPLPRAWKRAVKACGRAAERAMRRQLVEQALITDLRSVRVAHLNAVRAALTTAQGTLFVGEAFAGTGFSPENPVEACLLRESAAIAPARLPPADAVSLALARTAEERLSAIDREIYSQLALDHPRACIEIRDRLQEARAEVNVRDVVERVLAGERPAPGGGLTLDLDADLRSPR